MSARHAREAKRDKRLGFITGRITAWCQHWKELRHAYRSWLEIPPYAKTRGKPGAFARSRHTATHKTPSRPR